MLCLTFSQAAPEVDKEPEVPVHGELEHLL